MNESELVYQLIADLKFGLSFMFAWVSASMALVLLSHFFAERLNLFLVTFILIIYAAISWIWFGVSFVPFQHAWAIVQELEMLQRAGDLSTSSQGLLSIIGETRSFFHAMPVVRLVPFFGTVFYVTYRHIKTRAVRQKVGAGDSTD